MKYLLLFLITTSSFADVTCDDFSCTVANDVLLQNKTESTTYSVIDIINPKDELNITAELNEDNRDVKLYTNNTDGSGTTVNVNLSSTKDGSDAGDLILISNFIETLDVNTNGYVGQSYQSTSRECADRIKSGDYGNSIRSTFNQRRSDDPMLSNEQCDATDLANLQNQPHTCESGFIPSDGNITATRWVGKRKCDGKAPRRLCLRKTKQVTCTWMASYVNGCCNVTSSPVGTGWICDVSRCVGGFDSGWYKEKIKKKYEDEFIADLVTYGSYANACDVEYFPRTQNNVDSVEATTRNWFGGFDGKWRSEDLTAYYTIPTGTIYKIEFAVGGVVHSDNNSAAFLEGTYETNYFDNYNSYQDMSYSYLWQPLRSSGSSYHDYMLTYHSFLACKLDNNTGVYDSQVAVPGLYTGKVQCRLSTGGDTSDPTSYMRKSSSYAFKIKIHYLNADGQLATTERKYRYGHY